MPGWKRMAVLVVVVLLKVLYELVAAYATGPAWSLPRDVWESIRVVGVQYVKTP